MKITIEKRLETIEDLRLAKESLRKKAKQQEERLRGRTEALYNEVTPKRIYEEALNSFDVNNLMVQLLPYALKYKDELANNAIVEKLSKIKRKHVPYVVGGVAALGALVYGYFGGRAEDEANS